MKYDHQKDAAPQVFRRTKIETTYEYVAILGEVLGYWRKTHVQKAGQEVHVYLNHSLEAYDRIYLNGQQIEIPPLL